MDTTSLIILITIVAVGIFVGIRFYSRIAAYFEAVNTEMRKVNWPKRKELINNTLITLASTVVLSLFIFGADRIISFILEQIYS